MDYASPEALKPPHRYSPAVDVWALGVILHIMLVGYSPFWASSDEQLRALIARGKVRFEANDWLEISLEAKDLVASMLRADPAERITIDEALQHPFVRDQRRRSAQHLDATMGRMRMFNARRKFKAAARALMWGSKLSVFAQLHDVVGLSKKFTISELSRIREVFDERCGMASRLAPGAGAKQRDFRGPDQANLTYEEFQDVMEELDLGLLPLRRMFEALDVDRDGTINYKQLLSGLSGMSGVGEESLKFCYDMWAGPDGKMDEE